MKIYVQAGNLAGSLVDHLISPITHAGNVEQVRVFCHFPGNDIPNLKYHCPPRFLTKVGVTAVLYEITMLTFLTVFTNPTHIAGYKLFPHGLIALAVGKITRKPVIISLISGPVDLFSIGKPTGVNYKRPLPWLGRLLLKMLKSSDSIITTGSITKNFLVKHGIQESKIYPIVHPANRSRFYPVAVPKVYDIIAVGRLIPLKHFEVVVHGISQIKEKIPGIKACIVGEGPCKTNLIQLVNDLE
jgi:glycosyltransferase involved in cell wall biosynthesis